MITKKHFILFAQEIAREEETAREYLINFLIPILQDINPDFSRERFEDYINKKVIEREI